MNQPVAPSCDEEHSGERHEEGREENPIVDGRVRLERKEQAGEQSVAKTLVAEGAVQLLTQGFAVSLEKPFG